MATLQLFSFPTLAWLKCGLLRIVTALPADPGAVGMSFCCAQEKKWLCLVSYPSLKAVLWCGDFQVAAIEWIPVILGFVIDSAIL